MGTRMFRGALALSALLLCSGCGNNLLLTGLKDDGTAVEYFVGSKAFTHELGSLLGDANEATVPVLLENPSPGPWGLRAVVVGLGASFTAGVGPYQVGAAPRFRMVFSNSTSPIVP